MSSSWAAAQGDSSWRRGSPRAACGRSSVKSTHASAIPCTAPACFRPTALRNSICRDERDPQPADVGRASCRRAGFRSTTRTPAPLATVIDRPVFDRALADRAVAAGAEIRVGARVTALEVDQAGVRAMVGDAVVQRAPRGARLRRDLQVPAPVRIRAADHAICRRRSASSRPAAPGTSSCTSDRTSRPAVSPGRCRCCGPRARACGSA